MTASTQTSVDQQVQDKYVSRLRARLARPSITVADARDGMLDCFVSTYHTGVKHGLKGILGADASPDQVAQVTGRMFRDRLDARGADFDDPTVEALNDLKEEIDAEFHFSELPVEVSATHDQVCSLLLAKADGLLEHHGDRSVLGSEDLADRPAPAAPSSSSPPPVRVAPASRQAGPAGSPRASVPVPPAPQVRNGPPTSAPVAVAAPPVRVAAAAPVVPAANERVAAQDTSVTASLRQALTCYLDEIRQDVEVAEPAELMARLDRARALVQSIADFSR